MDDQPVSSEKIREEVEKAQGPDNNKKVAKALSDIFGTEIGPDDVDRVK
jgi:hypothetical protein